MPIQFTCDHCDGVLSIARRKAYALVDCPKCGCKQVVPSESKSSPKRAKENAAMSGNLAVAVAPPKENGMALKDLPLFERADFENLLQPGAKLSKDRKAETKPVAVLDAIVVATVTPIVSKSPTSELSTGVELVTQKNRIVVKRNHLALAAVLVIVLLVLAFGTGFMVARAFK